MWHMQEDNSSFLTDYTIDPPAKVHISTEQYRNTNFPANWGTKSHWDYQTSSCSPAVSRANCPVKLTDRSEEDREEGDGVGGINRITLSRVLRVRDLLIFSKVRTQVRKEEKARQITVLWWADLHTVGWHSVSITLRQVVCIRISLRHAS